MTTRYLDLVGGNDTNNGSSFVLRKKTLSSAMSGLVGGDTVRVMASPAASSLGINATWTNGSDTVTLASAVTANIDTCESAWTPSTNITATADATIYREGTHGCTLTSNGTFTTGLIAYHAMSLTDFSAYQQISLQLRGALTSGQLALKLCSDAAGATPVNTISITPAITTGEWYSLVYDTLAALGSSIQSVALYAVSAWTSKSVTLDNIIACKASASADSLTHNSYISKNTGNEAWFAIQSINGTSVKLWAVPAHVAALGSSYAGNYYGATATVTTYKREPIVLTGLQSSATGGTSPDSQLVIEGGYDTTAMTSKTDRTYVRQTDPTVGCLSLTGSYVNLKSFGVHTGSNLAFTLILTPIGGGCDDICVNGGWYGIAATTGDGATLGMRYAVGCAVPFHLYGTWGLLKGDSKITCDYTWSFSSSGSLSNNFVEDVTTSALSPSYITVDCADVHSFNIGLLQSSGSALYTVRNTAFTSVFKDFQTLTEVGYVNVTPSTGTGAFTGTSYVGLRYSKLNGDVTQNGRLIAAGGGGSFTWFRTATDQRHTASDVSWKFTFAGAVYAYGPASARIASIACVANEQRTVTLWMRRDSTNVSAQIRVKGGYVAGIASDIVASFTTAINTWGQVTLQFTPTDNCVVDVFCDAWESSGTNNLWIDDLGVA